MTEKLNVSGSVSSYSIYATDVTIGSINVIEYGLEQHHINEMGQEVLIRIGGISDDRLVVEQLIERLQGEYIDHTSLGYIVEDFINELSMI